MQVLEVQRKAEPGDSWQNVGFVGSKAEGGSGAEPLSYEYTDRDLPYAADSLTYRLKQVDTNRSARHTGKVTVRRGVDKVQLLGTYPNPAQNQTTVRYALPKQQDVKIRLYDVLGRRVQILVDGEKEGRQEIRLDAFRLPSGVYFLRLRAGGQRRTQKLMVVR